MKLETRALKLKAKIPTQGSDAYNMLVALNRGERISMLQGPSKFQTVAVSQRISDLRNKFGWGKKVIRGEFRKTRSGRRYMEYFM